MHVAQIAPLTEAIPPKLYGGTERVVSWLTEELIALGHEVTLFASGDSVTEATLEPVWPCALRLDSAMRDYLAPHIVMLEQVARRADEFDIIHLHLDYLGYPILRRTATPFLATLLTFGIDRIMFSVDYPYAPNAAGRKFLDRLSLAPADMVKLTHGNADALLKLKRG